MLSDYLVSNILTHQGNSDFVTSLEMANREFLSLLTMFVGLEIMYSKF